MKKIDCIKFFNELELLHLRFMEYYEYVDYFVIVEATKSHTGKNKPLYFSDNKSKFTQYLDKVIHVVVTDLPDYSVNDIWKAENFQRNCISRGLDRIAKTGDRIFISDCDEFWDINTAEKHIRGLAPVTFKQDLYYYYVNCLQNQIWDGSIMATYGNFQSPQQLRNLARGGMNAVYPGGWHYSFMGGADRIKTKVENIAESHLIINQIGGVDDITSKMNSATDLWNRTDEYAQKRFVDLVYAPRTINKFIELYPNFFKAKS
jgi:beta-1,4-mannosyl-glycoprotein beta-1,4-N-acetylglucosaminyltransferase